MMPNYERKGDYYVNPGLSKKKDEFNYKKGTKRSSFLWNQSINIICPIEENVFMMPNNKKKGDCYMNTSLSQLKEELQF